MFNNQIRNGGKMFNNQFRNEQEEIYNAHNIKQKLLRLF